MEKDLLSILDPLIGYINNLEDLINLFSINKKFREQWKILKKTGFNSINVYTNRPLKPPISFSDRAAIPHDLRETDESLRTSPGETSNESVFDGRITRPKCQNLDTSLEYTRELIKHKFKNINIYYISYLNFYDTIFDENSDINLDYYWLEFGKFNNCKLINLDFYEKINYLDPFSAAQRPPMSGTESYESQASLTREDPFNSTKPIFFNNCEIIGCNFSNCNFSARFSSCIIRNCVFGNCSLIFDIKSTEIYDSNFNDSQVLMKGRHVNLYNTNLYNLRLIEKSEFMFCNFVKCRWNYSIFNDSKRINFMKCNIFENSFQNCRFGNTYLLRSNINNSDFSNCIVLCNILSCNINKCIFNGIRTSYNKILQNSIFYDCEFNHSCFYSTNMGDNTFKKCYLNHSEFSKCFLNNSKFINCKISKNIMKSISTSQARLRGISTNGDISYSVKFENNFII